MNSGDVYTAVKKGDTGATPPLCIERGCKFAKRKNTRFIKGNQGKK